MTLVAEVAIEGAEAPFAHFSMKSSLLKHDSTPCDGTREGFRAGPWGLLKSAGVGAYLANPFARPAVWWMEACRDQALESSSN